MLGIVRSISYGLFGPPGEFVPQARALGAGLVRAYIYWSQVEPEPGRFTWQVIDALLDQLDGDDGDVEVWITLCSSSPWGTRVPTDFLPPSPAHDLDAYARFVRETVRRARRRGGKVRYWQCDNEPSNTGLLWSGTAEEYVAQLGVFHDAVKDADPAARVVLGGCGYDVFSSEPDSEPRRFFDHVVSSGRFDVFDAHLYGDPADDPACLAAARELMSRHGLSKPIVVGEYGGPVPFEFPAAAEAMRGAFMDAFAEPPATLSTDELKARQGRTPEWRAMDALYRAMPRLPPELLMFLDGCPPELSAKRHRIGCRHIVMHNILALAEGVELTAYWNLAREVPADVDPRQMMALMFDKLRLLDYESGVLSRRRPAADTFALLAGHLAGVEKVTRREWPGSIRVFDVTRRGRPPLLVLWDQRDPFSGEDAPPLAVSVPWPGSESGCAPVVTDAFGAPCQAEVRDGRLRLQVSDTPIFVTAR